MGPEQYGPTGSETPQTLATEPKKKTWRNALKTQKRSTEDRPEKGTRWLRRYLADLQSRFMESQGHRMGKLEVIFHFPDKIIHPKS